MVKSDKGWGVGLHQYEIATTAAWMDDNRSIAIPASHQDQVVALPAGARVLAGSDFTPFGVLAYDASAGQAGAISMQVHPEFDPAYAAALIEARRGSRYTDQQADAAIASLQAPNDRHRVAGWISRFLNGANIGPA